MTDHSWNISFSPEFREIIDAIANGWKKFQSIQPNQRKALMAEFLHKNYTSTQWWNAKGLDLFCSAEQLLRSDSPDSFRVVDTTASVKAFRSTAIMLMGMSLECFYKGAILQHLGGDHEAAKKAWIEDSHCLHKLGRRLGLVVEGTNLWNELDAVTWSIATFGRYEAPKDAKQMERILFDSGSPISFLTELEARHPSEICMYFSDRIKEALSVNAPSQILSSEASPEPSQA